MHRAAREFPDQPCFHRSEKQSSFFGFSSCTGNIFQKPADLSRTKVGIDHQACLFTVGIRQSFLCEYFAILCGSPVLPDDGVIDRLPRFLIPDDRGLTLVGDADGCNVFCLGMDLCQCLGGNGILRQPDLVCVMLHPPGLRKILRKFLLRYRNDLSVFVKQYAAAGCCPGIQRHDIFCHVLYPQYIVRLNPSPPKNTSSALGEGNIISDL